MGYLIQVMPPADLVPEVIRQICLSTNVSNAMILFNDNFVMDHKYKSLLLNVPTRHVMMELEENFERAMEQITRLRDLDIVHFFILGNEETITLALNVAETMNYTGRFYSWYMITIDDFTPHCNCKNMSIMFIKPELQKEQQLAELTSKGLLPEPLISSAFYYDLTRIAVMGMKAAIDAGEWHQPQHQLTCDQFNGEKLE